MLVFSWTNFTYVVLFKFWVCFTYSAIPDEVWEVILPVAEGKIFAGLLKKIKNFCIYCFPVMLPCTSCSVKTKDFRVHGITEFWYRILKVWLVNCMVTVSQKKCVRMSEMCKDVCFLNVELMRWSVGFPNYSDSLSTFTKWLSCQSFLFCSFNKVVCLHDVVDNEYSCIYYTELLSKGVSSWL